MGHVRVSYNLANDSGTYEVVVGGDKFSVNESFVDNFQDCLRVILEEYFVNIGGENITPSTKRLELTVGGNLPERERKILQRIVDMHNQIPQQFDLLRRAYRDLKIDE